MPSVCWTRRAVSSDERARALKYQRDSQAIEAERAHQRERRAQDEKLSELRHFDLTKFEKVLKNAIRGMPGANHGGQ